jgi:hypothetical protein
VGGLLSFLALPLSGLNSALRFRLNEVNGTPKSPEWLAGFRACLDLLKMHLLKCKTLEQVFQRLDYIESRVREKQTEEIDEELLLI